VDVILVPILIIIIIIIIIHLFYKVPFKVLKVAVQHIKNSSKDGHNYKKQNS